MTGVVRSGCSQAITDCRVQPSKRAKSSKDNPICPRKVRISVGVRKALCAARAWWKAEVHR